MTCRSVIDGVQRPVVVVIGDVLDEAERLRLDRRPLAGHRLGDVVDFDEAVLLGDIEPAVGAELQGGGIGKSAYYRLSSERDCHFGPRNRQQAGRGQARFGQSGSVAGINGCSRRLQAHFTSCRLRPSVASGSVLKSSRKFHTSRERRITAPVRPDVTLLWRACGRWTTSRRIMFDRSRQTRMSFAVFQLRVEFGEAFHDPQHIVYRTNNCHWFVTSPTLSSVGRGGDEWTLHRI